MSFDKQIPPRSMPALDTRALQAQKERFHGPQSDARSFVSMAAESALTSRPPGKRHLLLSRDQLCFSRITR